MRDYTSLVPRTPPEGLAKWVAPGLDVGAIVYETMWSRDLSPAAILGDGAKNERVVMCTCSLCGELFIADYAPPQQMERPYGFMARAYDDEYAIIRCQEGDEVQCPKCGGTVSVIRAAKIGRGAYVAQDLRVMSASLLPGPPGERPLVLTGWQVRTLVSRAGVGRTDIRPLEAYVFEARDACKLRGWAKSYSGTGGHSLSVLDRWYQPKEWSEEWGHVCEIYGLTSELVADSCLHNSKLDLYMAEPGDHMEDWRAPVAYLRLYQRAPQVENLVVQGAGYIFNRLLLDETNDPEWEKNRCGMPKVPELDLTKRRPSQILGLDRDEFARLVAMHWDLYHWRVYLAAKRHGDRMSDDDMEALHCYGGEDAIELAGVGPMGKSLRYLLSQMWAWDAANDPYNEYAEYEPPEDDIIDAHILLDYWRMAQVDGWDLTDPKVRWPKCLITAHDRAADAYKVMENSKLVAQFARRAQELARYAWTDGQLLIVPARDQADLTKEGSELHHCVAGYGKDVALGKTAIFFVRRAEAPDSSFYTLELNEKNLTVRQNRGLHNCARTKQVTEFETAWLAWLRAGAQRTEDNDPANLPPPGGDDKTEPAAGAA